MVFSFICTQCEADFDIEMVDLMKDPTVVICPNCNTKGNATIVENAMSSMDEVLSQLARLNRKFRVGFAIEPDELTEELESQNYLDEDSEDEDALWSDEPEEEDDDELM
jgi:DNA-directed RNA polymerase subunit RPC12/RpoP